MANGSIITDELGELIGTTLDPVIFSVEEGLLKKLSCQYRGMGWPRKMKTFDDPRDGETWHCKGKVIKKYTQGDDNFVDCQAWVENGKGEITASGATTLALPSKRSKNEV